MGEEYDFAFRVWTQSFLYDRYEVRRWDKMFIYIVCDMLFHFIVKVEFAEDR